MISDTDTTCTCIISDKGNGIVTHLSSGGLSIICHIISFLMQSVINLQGFRKDGSEQGSFSVWHHILCFKFVSAISEETAHLQPFSSNSPKVFPCLTVSKIYIFFSWQGPLRVFFLPFLPILISIGLLSLIRRPTLICIFIERCTVWRESLFLADSF